MGQANPSTEMSVLGLIQKRLLGDSSIDDNRQEMETGMKMPTPAVSRPSLPDFGSLSITSPASLHVSDSPLESLNWLEIGISIDDNRREMETGTKVWTPAVSHTSLPRFQREGSSIPSHPSLLDSDSLSIPSRPLHPVSDSRLGSLNWPKIGKSIDNRRETQLDDGDSEEMIFFGPLKDAANKGLRPPTPKEQEQETITKFAAEIREKTPMPKEQETRTKPPLARKKENGVRPYRGVRQRRCGKFGAEIRDSSQKGGKRWLGTFNSAEAAAHAYDRAAYEMRGSMHGSMARLNFPRDDAFAFAGNNTCPTVEKPKGNASQSTPLPHPSMREISEPFASEQQHDDLEINPVKLASGFAHWPSDSHHSIHPMIIASHVPAILSQATSLHAHQPGATLAISDITSVPEHIFFEASLADAHHIVTSKGGKRREISFQDLHPEVQGEMEKRREGREISFQDMHPEVLGEKEKGGKREEEVLGGKREEEEREKISFQDMYPELL